MPSAEFTEKSVIDWVKRQLGYPIVKVELDDLQLQDCVQSAIDEIAPWVLQRHFVTLPTSSCIDLSDYNVGYVINVHKTDAPAVDPTSGVGGVDIFSPYPAYRVLGTRDYLYTYLELNLINSTMQNMKDNISYRYIKPSLYLDIGIPSSSSVTIEYSNEILELSDITDRQYQRFVRRFSLAYARGILAGIRGKYSVTNSPVSLDAGEQSSKSTNELEVLRQELKNSVDTHFMID